MRILVTHLVPSHLCSELPVSEASNRFCWNLINGKCFDKVLGIVPVTVRDPIPVENSNKLHYYQTRIFGSGAIGKILNNLIDSFKIVKDTDSKAQIWFYNLAWTQLLSYVLLLLLRKQVYVIVADFTPSSRRFSIASITKFLIEHSLGIITLSSRSEFYHRNMDSIAGVVPLNEIEKKSCVQNPRNKKFLFSGGLEAIHGIDLAIKVFSKVTDAELYITGKKLEYDIEAYDNIKFLGYLSREEYESILNEVSFCLSFRNPIFPENLNNFPSKIIEFMAHNKIVISTMKYPELKGLKYICVDYNCQCVCDVIRDCITHFPFNEYQQEALVANFSPKKWIDTMCKMESFKRI